MYCSLPFFLPLGNTCTPLTASGKPAGIRSGSKWNSTQSACLLQHNRLRTLCKLGAGILHNFHDFQV